MDFGVQTPEKNGYKFNEITSLTGVKPYVLRFWESEFEQINPIVNEAGQKIYAKSDLLVVKTVKKLLFEDKLSIPEARNLLDKEIEAISTATPRPEVALAAPDLKEQSKELKAALEDIIEKGAQVKSEAPSEDFVCKASSLASRIKRDFKVNQRSLNERDVVNLVSAKKKLTKLLGTLQDLEARRGWN